MERYELLAQQVIRAVDINQVVAQGLSGLKRETQKRPLDRYRLLPRQRARVKGLNCVTVSGGRGGLHCLSRDESRRAYEASHLR
jgi:hypothetical protein